MPPKIQPKNSSKPGQASKKNKDKKVTKQAEDKTFGLKNKSGAKQQKFCAKVEQQLANSKKDIRGGNGGKPAPLTKKEQKEAYLAQLDAMLVPVDDTRKVILSKKQQEADKEKEVVYLTIEELVEVERLKLKNSGKELTKVTWWWVKWEKEVFEKLQLFTQLIVAFIFTHFFVEPVIFPKLSYPRIIFNMENEEKSREKARS